MKQLYFVRHGQSRLNRAKIWSGRTNTVLTRKGHRQAKQLGESLHEQGLHVDLIVCSPLARAHETARHIADQIGYDVNEIITNDTLVERHYGKLERRFILPTPTTKRYYLGDESALDSIEDAETIAELQARAEQALAYLQSLPQETVLVVAHNAFGRALRRAVAGDTSYRRGQAHANGQIVKLI